MASVLSTAAVTLVSDFPLTSTSVSPSVRLKGKIVASAIEVTLTVPDTGTCSILTEASRDNGTTWRIVNTDAFEGHIPIAGGSSSVRFFTRTGLVNDSNTLIRARVGQVTGSWLLTAKVDS